jgi:DNA-binding GntR family transcriptional regulator
MAPAAKRSAVPCYPEQERAAEDTMKNDTSATLVRRQNEASGDDEQFQVDRAYEEIRRRILDGSFRPGDHLREAQLAELSQTSRTPVRTALKRLSTEGLVMIGENRRSYVAEFNAVQADIVFEIRARLEGLAASIAAITITKAQIGVLEDVATRIEALGPTVSDQSLLDFMSLNLDFHRTIVEATNSSHLMIALYPAISTPLVLLKHHVWEKQVNIVQSNEQHREIIKSFKQRNAHWAEACMASHINSTRPASSPAVSAGTLPVLPSIN